MRFGFLRSISILRLSAFSSKVKFACEIGIFFVLAALISSIISIYFETKLVKYNNKIIELELSESIVQDWLAIAPQKNSTNKRRKFYFHILKNNEKIKIDKSAYDFYLLTRQENEVGLAIKAVEKVMLRLGISGPDDFEEMETNYPNKDFIQKYYWEFYHKWKTADREIENFVWNTIGDKKFDYNNEFFRNINHEDIKKFLDLNEHIYSQTILFFIEYNNIIDKQKNNLREKILTTTKKSTNAILYAFLLQLIIFCIIQFFELREISREKKNIK